MKKSVIIVLNLVLALTVLFVAGCGGGGTSTQAAATTATQSTPTLTTEAAGTMTMVFATQPGGAVSWQEFKTQPVVTVVDASGNTVTSFTGSVSITFKDLGSAQLYGKQLVVAVNGVATFENLSIDDAGTYVLKARSSPLENAFSAPFEVAAAP